MTAKTVGLALALAVLPCAAHAREKGPAPITVPIEARSGSKLQGTATFTQTGKGVQVVVAVSGVEPGEHAVHVHEKGDCSAADATSAGPHFNPGGHKHGLPAGKEHHLGDLGNMKVGKDGKGKLTIVVPDATLTEGDKSYLNRAIIVHEKVDDASDPAGNAGSRIGCGVITPAAK